MIQGHRHAQYTQAALVWLGDEIDHEQWLYYGALDDIGRDSPVRIDPKLAETMKKVEAEMPWLTSGIPK